MATIRKRGDLQWQAIVKRDGVMKSKTFLQRADAEKWARMTEVEIDRGVFIDRTETDRNTLHDILTRYRDEVTPSHKGAAVELLRINCILRDGFLVNNKLAALNSKLLAEWRDYRLKTVTGSTVNRELNILSAVINHARKNWGIHMDNPIELITRPKNEKARERRLEPDEEKKLIAELETSTRNPWIAPLVAFALETAMRRGEMLDLRWEFVDLKKRVARLIDTKNGESRNVPLSSRAVAALDGLPRSIDGRVFPTTEDALKKAFARACERAGIENFHFHDLRHEATSRLSEKLPNLIELASVTGHKDLRMLKRYYHPRAEDLARKLG